MEKTWHGPPINWFGGYMVARELLSYTKAQVEDEDKGSFLDKMNRMNFITRAQLVTVALNQFGPTLEGAQAIQIEGKGFFTKMPSELLAEKLGEYVKMLENPNAIWKFRASEFGELDFSEVPGDQGDSGLGEGPKEGLY